jgi:hypothetical protein
VAKPMHVRVVSETPGDTSDVTVTLQPSFASTPSGAHLRIMVALVEVHDFAVPVEGREAPEEFSAEAVRELWVW